MARGKGGSGRRYVRDNRGRFASKGAGATARGGRLRTASGKKRATQTMKVAGSGSKIRKPMSSGSNKPAQQISSKRQSAADRLKIKTATRRKLKTDRASVIPAKSAGPKTMKASRVSSTVAKPRTKGNSPQQVASRVQRKAAVNQANLKQITRYGNAVDTRQYARAIKSRITIERAQKYLKTGQKGKPTEKARRALAAAKRAPEMAAAKTRLAAKNAERKAARQQRAAANLARTADTRNKPGSTMIRRPSAKQSKSNRRAQTAVDIYSSSGTKRNQLVRNQAGLARTERARGNQLPTRDVRVAQAKAANLPLIKVTKPKKSDYDMKMTRAPKRRRR